jgi:hypothetical protein
MLTGLTYNDSSATSAKFICNSPHLIFIPRLVDSSATSAKCIFALHQFATSACRRYENTKDDFSTSTQDAARSFVFNKIIIISSRICRMLFCDFPSCFFSPLLP